jgi:hypothetical protein
MLSDPLALEVRLGDGLGAELGLPEAVAVMLGVILVVAEELQSIFAASLMHAYRTAAFLRSTTARAPHAA